VLIFISCFHSELSDSIGLNRARGMTAALASRQSPQRSRERSMAARVARTAAYRFRPAELLGTSPQRVSHEEVIRTMAAKKKATKKKATKKKAAKKKK
jgi:hypothetical protein